MRQHKGMGARMRIAADVGGTFTDVTTFDPATGELRLGKTLSTNDRIVDGIKLGVRKAGSDFADASLFLHGATVAINTILERSGARAVLVTTRGFRDIYEIGRINRPDAYNLFFKKHVPLIPRSARFEVSERVDSSGAVLEALSGESLEQLAREIQRSGANAIAIAFLNAYRNPTHELQVKAFLEQRFPTAFISASHELSREYREFERTSTVAANVYVGPRVQTYLDEIDGDLKQIGFGGRFLIVQSTGGLFDLAQARQECIRMLESGPAAGVIGVRALCEQIGLRDAIAFDMGGTTAKSGVVVNGEALVANQVMIGGYAEGLPAQIPMIDIQEVGTGGGSIARVTSGGALRVGPQSAGSKPGPACYGLGGIEPTVTDANLVLGRLSSERFLGGDMKLDPALAKAALDRFVGEPLGISTEKAADGIIRIAASSMANVVKRVTTERGLDVRDFPMVAIGGAGPLHASLIARELRISKVIIPNAPGHFSAYGMLVADLRRDFAQTMFVRLAEVDFDTMNALHEAMEVQGTADVQQASDQSGKVEITRFADMRYIGQEHAVTVELPMQAYQKGDVVAIKACFDAEHLLRYGFSSPEQGAEIVSIRSSVAGVMPKPTTDPIDRRGARPLEAYATQDVYFDGHGFLPTPVYRRPELAWQDVVHGPALVEENATTTVLLPGDSLEVDAWGNLHITVGLQ
ncbi:hydantoinase/oxoprolinase family protein [Paraburkholderia elongata]|uniref:Hydantoinase/oxoprolinase family protein n=1 Tax=Paraburkholderia elongata TaxID=2675747 RepID=A0A972NIT1_9BURK|nr:hydantoinase/oxoprolinase family protein [Paraburkholderia elongata]NPT53059.1 hydantoinase/oxoprolinase family protein [Paraburkholderia elongata]